MDYVGDLHKDPEEIPELIEKIIDGKRTSFRSIPDIEAQTLYFMRKILPFNLYRWFIEKALSLKS